MDEHALTEEEAKQLELLNKVSRVIKKYICKINLSMLLITNKCNYKSSFRMYFIHLMWHNVR